MNYFFVPKLWRKGLLKLKTKKTFLQICGLMIKIYLQIIFTSFSKKVLFCDEYHNNSFRKGLHQRLLWWHFWKHWIKNCPNSDLKHISELKQGTPLPFGSLNYADLLPHYFKDVKQFIVQYFTTDWSFCILNDSSGKYWWTLNNISL